MHLPFIQVAKDLIKYIPDLAAGLDIDEHKAGWMVVRLFDWAIGRCPDNAPPSHNDVVEGENAAKLIARACGYKGNPDRLVDALCRFRPSPILERTKRGIRIRGLDRYDSAWGKNHPELWRKLKQSRTGSGPRPDRNRSDFGAPDADADAYAYADTEQPQQPSAPDGASAAAAAAGGLFDPETTPFPPASASVFWSWIAWQRSEAGLNAERVQPKGFTRWFDDAAARYGSAALVHAYKQFRHDDDFSDKQWPTAVFITEAVWSTRLPPDPSGASP